MEEGEDISLMTLLREQFARPVGEILEAPRQRGVPDLPDPLPPPERSAFEAQFENVRRISLGKIEAGDHARALALMREYAESLSREYGSPFKSVLRVAEVDAVRQWLNAMMMNVELLQGES